MLEGLIVPFPCFPFPLEKLQMSLLADALVWGEGRGGQYSYSFYLSNAVCFGLCSTGEFFSITPVLQNYQLNLVHG